MATNLTPAPEPRPASGPTSQRRAKSDLARRFAVLLAVMLLVADAAWPSDVMARAGTTHERHQQKRHQTGVASFYGRECKDRRTASGERFDPNLLTAAHRTLPFGTRVKVTNLDNGKHVIVRINDRGPYAKGRVLDLSRAAARKLGFVHEGVAYVRLDVLKERGGLPWRVADDVTPRERAPEHATSGPGRADKTAKSRVPAIRKGSLGRA